MKLAIPDKISPSYFVAEAAVELGFFKDEGLDVSLELVYPVDKAYEALRDGRIDFVGGAAHAVPAAFPGYKGAKLIAAQAQGMYWFLVMRSDLGAKRGDLSVVKGRTIGAAPWVNTGLRGLLIAAGIDLERDKVNIAPVPGLIGDVPNFGVMASKALEDRKLDGFWANGMGAEVAVRGGYGTVVIDARRGVGRADRTFARHGCRGGARHRQDAGRVESRCIARRRSRTKAVSADRGRPDQRANPPRPALLRRDAVARIH